jgi:tetratricopeptide (TPR) repeat protein
MKVKIYKRKKIINIIFRAFLILLILEVGFRIGDYVSAFTNKIVYEEQSNKDSYRILVLGESTSMDTGFSWPEQLQDILDNETNQKNIRIINEAKDGTNSVLILLSLEQNLEKYDPNMVITMMGNNDFMSNIYYERTMGKKIAIFFENIRLLKLSKIILYNLKDKLNSQDIEFTDEDKKSYTSNNSLIELGKKYRNLGDLEKSEIFLLKALEMDPDDNFIYEELGWLYTSKENPEEALKMFEKAIELNPKKEWIYIGLGWNYDKMGEFRKAEEMYKKAIKINPDNLWIYTSLLRNYENQNKSRSEFGLRGIKVEKKNISTTYYHYKLLYKTLSNQGIKLVVMQYPLRDIQEFKNFFSEEQQKDIIFVENRDNFEKVLENASYEDLFIDRFAGDFGHCTVRGNKLIAENVADILLEELNID